MNEKYFDSRKIYTPSSSILQQAKSNDYYELQKQATAFKDIGNWDFALACLYKAKEISLQNQHSPEPQYITRLAIFLQQAGMFEEAVSELHNLFELADTYTKYLVKGIRKNKKLYFAKFRANYLEHLFDKAALIYKREKELDKATYFKGLSAHFLQESSDLDNKISDIESAEYEKELVELSKPESKLTQDDWDKIRKLTNGTDEEKKMSSHSKMIVRFLLLVLILYSAYAYFF